MYSALFFVYGLLQVGLFAWLLRLWRETRQPVARMLILPQFFLIGDNRRVAVGPLPGFGDLPNFWSKDIHPVCEHDMIRYGGSVTAATRCFPDQALTAPGGFPLAPGRRLAVRCGAGRCRIVRPTGSPA